MGEGDAKEREGRGKRGEEVAQANVKFIYAYVCMYSLTLVLLYLSVYVCVRECLHESRLKALLGQSHAHSPQLPVSKHPLLTACCCCFVVCILSLVFGTV